MEKILKTTAAVCAGILVMLFIEGMFTFGAAFCFEKYNVFGWIIQGVILLLAISFSAWLSINDNHKK
jgi:hypothetical protein